MLVTEHDGEPVPKVIDFGVVKAIGSPLTDKTLFTRFEQMIGTPLYMSPEQTGLGSLDVDTRTDIYSLGVLLYELLTGTTPLERDKLENAAVEEIRRNIRETQPPKPSTRLQEMGEKLAEVAKHRKVEPGALTRLLQGDLDWVIMKSLEKDRKRRFETANELAADIERYLNHEPVVARPPSKPYRFRKFVQRNRVWVGGTGVVALGLLLGSGVAAWRFFEEKKARIQAEQISRFLKEMLGGVAPSVALGRNTEMLHEILDRTAEQMDAELKNQPAVEAELAGTIAQVYFELGDFQKAEKLMRRTAELLKQSMGERDPSTAQALANLGVVLRRERKLAEAEKLQREILALRKKRLGEIHAGVAESYNNLGAVLYDQEKFAEAEASYRHALEISRKVPNQEKLQFLSLNNLALALSDQNRLGEAETGYREALAVLKKISTNDTPDLAEVLNNLGLVLSDEGKLAESEQAHRQALGLQKRFLPSDHRDIADSMNNLALVLREQDKFEAAEEMCRQTLAMRRRMLGDNDPAVAQSVFTLANVLADQRKFGEAEERFRECLALREKLMPESWKTFSTRSTLGVCLAEQRKYVQAEPLLVSGYQGMKQREQTMPADNKARMKQALECLVKVSEATARPEKAAQWRRELEAIKQPAQAKGAK